jgi:tetratricopeptide (TPR) repeat protein
MNTKEKVLIHKGIDKVKRMEYEEALEIFDRVIEMNPKIPEAWNNRGVALFRLARVEEALESCDRSLAIDAENLEALRNKGFALRQLGRLEEAFQAYDMVLRKGGEALDMEAAASVLVALGRLEEALDFMMQAVSMEPLDRFMEEIEALKGMIMQRDGVSLEGKE